MAHGFVSAGEVAFVVSEYLRQEGFQRTLNAFQDEASMYLSSVTAGRAGRSLCSILSEYVRMKRSQAAREECVHVAYSDDSSTTSMIQRTMQSVVSLLDDYAATKLGRCSERPQELGCARQHQRQSESQPQDTATSTSRVATAVGADNGTRSRPTSTAHQSPSKKRKSSHPRRSIVSTTTAPRALHWQDHLHGSINPATGDSDSTTQPANQHGTPVIEAVGAARPNLGGAAVLTATGIIPRSAQMASPARLSAIEDETFEQLLTNDGVHTAIAEVLTTRLDNSATSNGAAGELATSTATGRLPPSLAVEDILKDCAAAAAAAQQQGGDRSTERNVVGSGSQSGSGWQPQKVFNAILALEPPYADVGDSNAAGGGSECDGGLSCSAPTISDSNSAQAQVGGNVQKGTSPDGLSKRRAVDFKSLLGRLDYTSGAKK